MKGREDLRRGQLHEELIAAITDGNVRKIAELYGTGINVNKRNGVGETPLIIATRTTAPNVLAVVDLLLSAGADVTARAQDGSSALMWAVARGSPDLVALLLSYGADPTQSWCKRSLTLTIWEEALRLTNQARWIRVEGSEPERVFELVDHAYKERRKQLHSPRME